MPAVLLQSGATLRCTVPAAPGLAAGAVTVQAGERAESDDLILDGEGEATLVYYEAAELPSLSTLYPPAGLAATPTEVRMIGTNFAPLGVDARCAFGADGLTTATFISPTVPRLWWRARPGLWHGSYPVGRPGAPEKARAELPSPVRGAGRASVPRPHHLASSPWLPCVCGLSPGSGASRHPQWAPTWPPCRLRSTT